MSSAARQAVNVAQLEAQKAGGHVEMHNLLVAWAHDLPYADCALARALNDPAIFPGLSEVLREREMVRQKMITQRHSPGVSISGLVTAAKRAGG